MLQAIEVKASNALILKGIADLEDMLYKQTDIKPDQYLAVIQYLKVYSKSFQQQDKTVRANEEDKQKATITSNNFDICLAIDKITKMLYKQTAIKPVVYLILIDKMNEYKELLQQQDNGTFVEKVLPSEEPKTTSEQTATKNNSDMNLSGLKKLF